jgi:hypothetical protein
MGVRIGMGLGCGGSSIRESVSGTLVYVEQSVVVRMIVSRQFQVLETSIVYMMLRQSDIHIRMLAIMELVYHRKSIYQTLSHVLTGI